MQHTATAPPSAIPTAPATAPAAPASTPNRRRRPRHLVEAQIMVLYPEFWQVGDVDKLSGWTINLSENGVCFSLPTHVTNRELVLHIDYEGMGAEYVLVRVVDLRKTAEGDWRYHAAIVRSIASINALDSVNH